MSNEPAYVSENETVPNATEGWAWMVNATKWHYFRGGLSLCGKWMLLAHPKYETGNDTSPDNCKACKLKLNVRTKEKS